MFITSSLVVLQMRVLMDMAADENASQRSASCCNLKSFLGGPDVFMMGKVQQGIINNPDPFTAINVGALCSCILCLFPLLTIGGVLFQAWA